MPVPTWLAATSGQPTQGGQVNQFLGTHGVTFLYSGIAIVNQQTPGTGSINSTGLYVAQSFTAGSSATSLGRFAIGTARTGAPLPLTVALHADNGGKPAAAALISVSIPYEPFGASLGLLSVPLPYAPLAANTRYWLVAQPNGDAADYFSFFKSTQTSGAATSTDGVTWTTQNYGLVFYVVDQTPTGALANIWEDGGARWVSTSPNLQSLLGAMVEFTQGQTAAGYLVSIRGLNYTHGQLTGIS